MSKDLPNHSTIHISIPQEADNDEAEWFLEEVIKATEDIEIKGEWDPHTYWHTEACDDSDHCYGPGSRAEDRIHDETLDEVIASIRSMARGYQSRKLGNMTWAEVLVVINGMKRNQVPPTKDPHDREGHQET